MFRQISMNNTLNHESTKKVDYLLETGVSYTRTSQFISKCDMVLKIVTRTGYEFICKNSNNAIINGKAYNGLFFSIFYTFPSTWLESIKNDTSEIDEILYTIINTEPQIYNDIRDSEKTLVNFEKKGFIPVEEFSSINNNEIVYIPHLDVIVCSPQQKITMDDFPEINIENADIMPEFLEKQSSIEKILYTHNSDEELIYDVLNKEINIPNNYGHVSNFTIRNVRNGRSYSEIHDVQNVPTQFQKTDKLIDNKIKLKQDDIQVTFSKKEKELLEALEETKNNIKIETNRFIKINEYNRMVEELNKELLNATHLHKVDNLRSKILREKVNNTSNAIESLLDTGLLVLRTLVVWVTNHENSQSG